MEIKRTQIDILRLPKEGLRGTTVRRVRPGRWVTIDSFEFRLHRQVKRELSWRGKKRGTYRCVTILERLGMRGIKGYWKTVGSLHRTEEAKRQVVA